MVVSGFRVPRRALTPERVKIENLFCEYILGVGIHWWKNGGIKRECNGGLVSSSPFPTSSPNSTLTSFVSPKITYFLRNLVVGFILLI